MKSAEIFSMLQKHSCGTSTVTAYTGAAGNNQDNSTRVLTNREALIPPMRVLTTQRVWSYLHCKVCSGPAYTSVSLLGLH